MLVLAKCLFLLWGSGGVCLCHLADVANNKALLSPAFSLSADYDVAQNKRRIVVDGQAEKGYVYSVFMCMSGLKLCLSRSTQHAQ